MLTCHRMFISLALLGSWVLVTAEAQAPSPPTSPSSPQAAPASGVSLDDLELLSMQAVRDQIKLGKPQSDKLDQATQQYYQDQQKMLSELENVGTEQRQQKLSQLRKQAAQRLEQVGQQVKQLLSPEQLSQLQQLRWQMTAYASLANGGVGEQLHLSPQQQQQLQQVYQQTQNKVWQLQQQAAQQVLQVLTPQQQEQLKTLAATPQMRR